ncbi:D-sedoheptulose 7-phosphate isomerase [Blochmannia endosymbiont of Colobopsis nipponica]|uniref:D-sedoheptulose 7-phosphate isomerase n=1 Tax=Blochmannia endosymbiont of Colobopsis nipponica TaxID=2681987 RepID=UPI0017862986|nr:D-sedoheptulose 7-phosphate isomerase [Blochmannia endosymbiont of Colobopsis nipponica]QOI11194.1 D-sedoheptulose 7-phosphate isomerase [Blochmannia endosymbiont of Colobopsis nipponica]
MYHKLIFDEFNDMKKAWDSVINDKSYMRLIESAAHIVISSFKKGGKILTCGNGGSHCNAMHFAEELTGRYRNNRLGYPAIAISDPSYISCASNDFGYEYVFSRYIESLANHNDVLLAITTSGKSLNILYAIESAFIKNMRIIALTGTNIGKINNSVVDVEICTPHFQYADRVQEIHIKFIHVLVLLIEKGMSLC